eukprot:365787-Chlamydomonas_euryale.AAC.5
MRCTRATAYNNHCMPGAWWEVTLHSRLGVAAERCAEKAWGIWMGQHPVGWRLQVLNDLDGAASRGLEVAGPQ